MDKYIEMFEEIIKEMNDEIREIEVEDKNYLYNKRRGAIIDLYYRVTLTIDELKEKEAIKKYTRKIEKVKSEMNAEIKKEPTEVSS